MSPVVAAPVVDLDALLGVDLPPCQLLISGRCLTHGDLCGAPSVAMVRAKCAACERARQFGACDDHAAILREQVEARGPLDCVRCGAARSVDLWGLS